MGNKLSFKNSFKYCEALGCTPQDNIIWCCPEMLPICKPKSEFLKSMGEGMEDLGYSENLGDVNKLDKIFIEAFSKHCVTAKHKNSDSEYVWKISKELYADIEKGDIVKVDTVNGVKEVEVLSKNKRLINNIGKPINRKVLSKVI